MISEKKNIIGGKIKEKDYIISFHCNIEYFKKKKIFKYIILIITIFLI